MPNKLKPMMGQMINKPPALAPFIEAMKKAKRSYQQERPAGSDLQCRFGWYGQCAVIKLQKASWTNDDMKEIANKSGIFFSIWLGPADVAAGKAHYNIHALKLRELKGYRLTSRLFADDFRNAFRKESSIWPNVEVDHGPLTLMQGWFKTDASSFQSDVIERLTAFESVSLIIDRLLAERTAISGNGVGGE